MGRQADQSGMFQDCVLGSHGKEARKEGWVISTKLLKARLRCREVLGSYGQFAEEGGQLGDSPIRAGHQSLISKWPQPSGALGSLQQQEGLVLEVAVP